MDGYHEMCVNVTPSSKHFLFPGTGKGTEEIAITDERNKKKTNIVTNNKLIGSSTNITT